jgi:hypothetical protein
MLTNFFIYFTTLLSISSSNHFLQIPFHITQGSFYLTLLSSKKNLNLPLDMSIPFTFTTPFHFTIPSSQTYSMSVTLNSFQYKAALITETFYIESNNENYETHNITIPNYQFYLIEDTSIYLRRDDGISFSYKYTSLSNSIIHILYEYNIISSKSFAFITNNEHRGMLYLGKNNNLDISNYKSFEINVDKDKSQWGSSNLVQIGICLNGTNYVYNIHRKENEGYFYFQTAVPYIYVSQKFFNFIIDVINKEELNDECWVSETKNQRELYCNEGILMYFDNINLNFNNAYKQISMKLNEMFECQRGICRCDLIHSMYMNKNNNIIFGVSFITKFYMSEFNYDKNMITLFTRSVNIKFNDLYYTNTYNQRKIKILYILTNCMCLIMGVCLFIINIKYQ